MAELAEAAAWRLQRPQDSITTLRRAALAHDLGRVGVSNAIWKKPGSLAFGEWVRVRLHAHFTERAFAQSPALADIGRLAGSHHERLDGSGYHRGARGPDLDAAARILAAADCYSAMREARPYRPALGVHEAELELQREAGERRLDPDAVDAVLAAAGHRVAKRSRELPAGLTPRELEVLLALVRGDSNQAIGDSLGISVKTVGHHVQHIYDKAGVRAGRPRRSGRSSRISFGAHRAFARCVRGGPRRYSPAHRRRPAALKEQQEADMFLATTTVEDYERFERIFSTSGAEKRRQHGSKGAQVFRDPNGENRVWVLFDWDAEGWQSFVSDPDVPPILQEAGHRSRPQIAAAGGSYDA